MKYLRIAQFVLLLPLMVYAIGLSLPEADAIQREIFVETSPDKVYRLLDTPSQYALWAPWFGGREPSGELLGEENGRGASIRWQESGTTYSLTISSSVPYKFLTTELHVNRVHQASLDFTVYNNKQNTDCRLVVQYRKHNSSALDKLWAALAGDPVEPLLEQSLQQIKLLAEVQD